MITYYNPNEMKEDKAHKDENQYYENHWASSIPELSKGFLTHGIEQTLKDKRLFENHFKFIEILLGLIH